MDDRCLLFFVKNPERGKVKSRLAVAIGEDSAVHLYKNLVKQTLSTLRRGTFPFCICFTPRNAEKSIQNWLGREHRYMPQHGSDLGERMKNGFLDGFATGYKRVVLIGSDIPDLPNNYIEEAFQSLEETDAIIGPAFDGGYYLIGFRQSAFSSQVFEEIHWGTATVFDETMKKLKRLRRSVHTLPWLRDIDTVEDLEHLKSKLSPSGL